MQKLLLINIHVFCYFLFKFTKSNDTKESYYEKKLGYKITNPSEKVRSNLQKILLLNMGLKPDEVVDSENFAELSEKLPHFVPDFMKLLYVKYRSNLYNFSVEIEGKPKHLGPVEMVHCQRLRNIQTWSSVGIHKLIFKSFTNSKNSYPLARELRINKRLFPRIIYESSYNESSELYMIIMIFDERFKLLKEKLINSKSFNKQGWISIDISKYLQNSVFFIKTFGLWKKHKLIFKRVNVKFQIQQSHQLYLYYANIVTFYSNKILPSTNKRFESTISETENLHLSRVKRDTSSDMPGHEEDCQRYPLIVTFKEVGWSKWIIAPQNYNAYYCKGNCPYPLSDNFNATNHAIIQLLVHGLKDLSIPKPCCVPYHLHPETLLYLNNEGDALLREFKDMSVSSCSCR